MKDLKERVQRGETVIGTFLNLGSSLTAEIVAMAGFDWLLIDLEHGAGSEREVLHQLQAIEHTRAAGIVRVESHERQRAHRVLDLGASGIMFPRVNTATEAATAASALRYPPDGVRGVATMNRACGFGPGFRAYADAACGALLGVMQIESREALDNLDAIAATGGVDVLFVGPMDLTQSLGISGQFEHAGFQDAAKLTAAAARRHGKQAGILLPKPEQFAHYHDMGYRFLACGSDGGLLATAARQLAAAMGGRGEGPG